MIHLSKYAHDNYLIENPGCKKLQCYTRNTKNMNRLLKAANANQRRNTLNIKFGMKITRYHKEAMMFDADNENINWKDYELLELKQI